MSMGDFRLATRTRSIIRQKMRRVRPMHTCMNISPESSVLRSLPQPSRAIQWLRAHESDTGGILVYSGYADAYPEVTGYLVPTLLRYGEREFATRLVRWLLCIQRADGSYASSEGLPYVFDTGQVLRGLLAPEGPVPGTLEASRRAASYILSQMVGGGRKGFRTCYSGAIPESVHLYVLPPLLQAAEVLHEPQYRVAAERCLQYYLTQKDTLQVRNLTHFLGYELEALIELDRTDMAKPLLDALRGEQASDGSVRGLPNAPWVCTPGLAQLALCWYKIGDRCTGDKAMDWLDEHQTPSGGFRGSYGPKASYFSNVELSWATKFYLDAHMLRLASFVERNPDAIPSEAETDGLLQVILSTLRPGDRLLEAGCAKKPFSALLRGAYPNAEMSALPLSGTAVPKNFQDLCVSHGSLESIPFPENSVDVVFSVGALTYSANPEAAVAEMIRVTRPGGQVLIVVGRYPHGAQRKTSWQWRPDATEMRAMLNRGCDDVRVESVGSGGAFDQSMITFRARKRSRLSAPQWTRVLLSEHNREALVNRVRRNKISEWGQVILLNTAPGERVLEIGSGTGEISLQLALAGRTVTALDFSPDSLEFIRRCARELDAQIETKLADAMHPLPFADDAFDCTWSSGLLEHFTSEERRLMLREMARATSGKVITLVPNASCVAYRAGKTNQEEQGVWPYGLEIPLISMREDFEAAGLRLVSEYSVGTSHALSFLPENHPLRKSLYTWMRDMPPSNLQNCNQGYLLATIGTKRGENHRC